MTHHVIQPDATGTPTLWRYATSTDQNPLAVLTRDQVRDPDVWGVLEALYAQPVQVDGPLLLLTGAMPLNESDARTGNGERIELGGRLLVTVWANGKGEAAWKRADVAREPWYPPSELDPAP